MFALAQASAPAGFKQDLSGVGDIVRCQLRSNKVNGDYGHLIRLAAERVATACGAPHPASWPRAKRDEFWAHFLEALDDGSGADAVAAWHVTVTSTSNAIQVFRSVGGLAAAKALVRCMEG